MKSNYLGFLSLYFCVIFSIPAYPNAGHPDPATIILRGIAGKYNTGYPVLLFEDKSGQLTFQDIRTANLAFTPMKTKAISLGTTSSAIWCIFRVKNGSKQQWFLEIDRPYIDNIELYSIDQANRIDSIKTGLSVDFRERPVKVNFYMLPLNLDPDEEKIYYLKAYSNSILKIPLNIDTIQSHYETNHRNDLANGIYFGLILALCIYNFFVFISLRDKTYLYYVFYVFFLGVTISWLRGYSQEFLNALPHGINQGNTYSALAFIFLMLFTNSFLNLKKIAPRIRHLVFIFYTFSFLAIFLSLFGNYHIGFHIITIMVALSLPYVVSFGIYALNKGFRPAIFYLIGFTCFTIGDFVFMLQENSILPDNVITDNSLQLGSAIEAIILSFALANKLTIFKKEKEETQAKALARANQFSKELIQTQEAERKRIAGELHDSVGQSLSLIKNRIILLKKNRDKHDSLDELSDVVTNTIQEVRSISYGLRPFQLDILGLSQSLRSLAEDVSEAGEINFKIHIDNIDALLPKDAEINIFRIVQECLSNISKHSRANEAKVEIKNIAGNVEILVEDNGIGIEDTAPGSGLGLIGIKERTTMLGGNLAISNKQPQGTKVSIFIARPE